MLKKIGLAALLGALLLSASAQATPTRLLTIDNMSYIVPDDWDATTYYSLAPNFKNNFYFDTYADGRSFGWAFLDVGIGTLVIWYNKPFEGGALYDAATFYSPGIMGLQKLDLTAPIANAWDPREKRVKVPDNKLALGYAVEVGDSLNLGFCFRLAQLNQTADSENQDGAGASGAAFGLSNGFQNNFGGNYAGFSTFKYANTQASSGLVLSPQFSYLGESLSLDFKFDMVWAGVDNKHSESLENGANTASISQSLKDRGKMSFYVRPKARYRLSESSSLAFFGSFGQLDFSTEHRVKGSFSGTGYTAIEQAGYDFADATQDLGITQWQFTLGLLKSWNNGKDLVVMGFMPQGQIAHLVATNFQTRNAATTYNDVVRATQIDATLNDWAVPMVFGSELSVSKWCKARGSVSRNFFSSSSDKAIVDSYDNSGTLLSKTVIQNSTDAVATRLGPGWAVNMGFGFNFESFSWDTALNTTFLASNNAAMTNPLFQSSFTYGF